MVGNSYSIGWKYDSYKADKTKIPTLDPSHPLVQPKTHNLEAIRGDSFSIPCKPTSPDVNVELLDENGTVSHLL